MQTILYSDGCVLQTIYNPNIRWIPQYAIPPISLPFFRPWTHPHHQIKSNRLLVSSLRPLVPHQSSHCQIAQLQHGGLLQSLWHEVGQASRRPGVGGGCFIDPARGLQTHTGPPETVPRSKRGFPVHWKKKISTVCHIRTSV